MPLKVVTPNILAPNTTVWVNSQWRKARQEEISSQLVLSLAQLRHIRALTSRPQCLVAADLVSRGEWRWAAQQQKDIVGGTAEQNFPKITNEAHLAKAWKYWGDEDLEGNLRSCMRKLEWGTQTISVHMTPRVLTICWGLVQTFVAFLSQNMEHVCFSTIN